MISHVAWLSGVASNAASMLLLGAFFFASQEEREPASAPVSRFLAGATQIAVVCWGLVVVVSAVRVAMVPYTYRSLLEYASKAGTGLPQVASLWTDAIRTLISQLCVFAAPFIVFRRT